MAAVDPDAPTTRPAEVKRWLGDIDAAVKREDDYRKDGKRLWKMYEGELKDETPFNILFSNTEILLPALYGARPRPIVQRRFKDADPLGLAASKASERMLSFLMDTNSEEYDDFDTTMKENVLDACVPGRGLMEFCYDGKTVKVPQPDGTASEQLSSECVYPETCLWNRYTFGYAKKWKDVPWVAFELYFDLKAAKEEFTPAVAVKLKYVTEGDQDKESKDSATREGARKVAQVWKIWDKTSRRLLFVSQGYEDYLKECEDPYSLTGFFPIPKPLRLIAKSANLAVTAPYNEYENQAKELNRLTTRINKLIDMLKVRGAYDSSMAAIEEALKKDDGELVAADQPSTMTREGGLDKHIWLMPIEKVVLVVQQLYIARTACKQVIYEIMGLADIMRGSTQASETLGAQQLKAQFGSVRMKNPQKEVQRYARDCLRIMLELAVNRFLPETWAKMTGLPYLTDAQAAQAQQAQQMAMQQASMAAMQASQGQPAPPPPQLPPMPPKWSDILSLLKNDLQREYKIDIETNSTVDPDASEAKKNMGELMAAMSQFLNGVGPLVQEGVLPIEAAKAMLLGVARQYEFGSEVEDLIRQMQPPQPQAQDKSGEQALQTQLAKSELEKQGMAQNAEAEKKSYDLGLREAALKAANADLAAREELFRIQTTAAKGQMQSEHKVSLAQHKQVKDEAVGRVEQIAKEIDLKIKADAQSRATEKQAADKVSAEKEKSAAKGAALEGLIKDLHVAIQALTKATTAKRTLVKNKDGSKTVTTDSGS
jgi:hypothetical protein